MSEELEPFEAEEGKGKKGKKGKKAEEAPKKEEPKGVVLKKHLLEREAKEEESKVARKAVLVDKLGNPVLDEDGHEQELAPGAQRCQGYVNGNGVLFPVGFVFRRAGRKVGHVGWRGNVVLKQCPVCNYNPMSDEAVMGACANSKGPPDGKTACQYSLIAELEEVELA